MEINLEKLIKDSIKRSEELIQERRYSEADLLLSQTIRVDQENTTAKNMLGLIKYYQQKYTEAIEVLNEVLEKSPDNAESHNNLALCYSCINDFAKSISHLKMAIKIKPSAAYYNNLGLQYRHKSDFKLSIYYFKKAIKEKNEAFFWLNLGSTYGECRKLNKAINCLKKAIELDANLAAAHVNLAYCYQLQGQWTKAWPEYEWRFDYFEQTKRFTKMYDKNNNWDGKQDIKNKKIIIYCEQGTGDVIQFLRYLPQLKQKQCHIILHCPPELESLCKQQDYVDEIITLESNAQTPPIHDFHASIMSLPYLFDTSIIPNSKYLKTYKKCNLENYKQYYKIGIVWAGSPYHPNDFKRSCYLNKFKPIYEIPNTKLFSLQKFLAPRVYHNSQMPIDFTENCEDIKLINMAEFINNFEDTASIVKELDLIVTVDTAILHLAGALGKKTYALIPYNPCWRWKLGTKKTEWYPSVTLFRQTQPNRWEDVIENIKRKICENIL